MSVIAIALCSKPHDYEESIQRAGGKPWVFDPAVDRPEKVLRRAGGLLLTGGGDVDPSIYGEAPHPTYSAAEDGRDAYEIDLVRRALEANLHVFAICRGMQVMNVARGGTLVQDIASQMQGALPHKRQPPDQPYALAHEIWMEKFGNPLARSTNRARDSMSLNQITAMITQDSDGTPWITWMIGSSRSAAGR